MDEDFDLTLAPSGTIYGARAVMLDPANTKKCYLGGANARCVGITPQQSQYAPGLVGNTAPPFILADTTNGGNVPVYGPGRKCLWDVDPSFNGQIAPNDLVECSDSGYATKAQPTGAWNRWIVAIALAFASKNQSCNVMVIIFPWMPTGS